MYTHPCIASRRTSGAALGAEQSLQCLPRSGHFGGGGVPIVLGGSSAPGGRSRLEQLEQSLQRLSQRGAPRAEETSSACLSRFRKSSQHGAIGDISRFRARHGRLRPRCE